MRASFHFPLHRYLAAFICQAVRHMGVPIADLLPETEMLMLLMMHPLRVQVSAVYFIFEHYKCTNNCYCGNSFLFFFQCTYAFYGMVSSYRDLSLK